MKKYSLILILLFLNHAKAYCPQHVITTFPESGSKIVQDQIFIFFLTNFPFIENLSWSEDGQISLEDSKNLQFLFVSKNHTTKVKILKKFRGDSRHNQFLIIPKELLQSGEKYHLAIKVYNYQTKIYETFPLNDDYSWIIKEERYQVSSQFQGLIPKLIGREYFEFGCGPVNMVNFRFPFVGDQIVISELIDLAELTSKLAINVVLKGEIGVGRGMCGGSIEFKRNHRYKIRFKAVNNQGEESEYGDFIEFKSP
jgi:hypothetical protein